MIGLIGTALIIFGVGIIHPGLAVAFIGYLMVCFMIGEEDE